MADGTDFDLGTLLASFNDTAADISKYLPTLNAGYQAQRDAAASTIEATRSVAGSQADINLLEAGAKAKADADTAKAAASYGTLPSASSYVVDSMASSIRDDETEIMKRDAGIQKKLDVGIFDNPVDWLVNQITLPGEIDAYNSKVTSQQQKLDYLSAIQARTREAAVTNAAIEQVDATKKAGLVNQIVADQANLAVAKSQEGLGKLGVSEFGVRQALSINNFEMVSKLNSAQNSVMSLQLQKDAAARSVENDRLSNEYRSEQLAISKEQLNLAKESGQRAEESALLTAEQRRQMIDARTEAANAKASLQVKLNNATDTLGMNRITFPEFQLMSGQQRQSLEMMISDPDIQNGRLGHSTANALDNANNLNAPLTPGMNQLRSKLIDIRNGVAKGDLLWSQKKPAEQQVITDTKMQEAVINESKNIPDQGGMFSPAPLAKVLQIPIIQQLSLAQDLAPLGAADPEYPTRANDIWNMAIGKINKGEATPAQMAFEISTIYKAINLDNQDLKQYRRFAIPAPTSFNTNVYLGTGWNSSAVINMTSAPNVEAQLTRNAIAIQRQNAVPKSALGITR